MYEKVRAPIRSHRTTIRMRPAEDRAFAVAAQVAGVTPSELAREAIREKVAEVMAREAGRIGATS